MPGGMLPRSGDDPSLLLGFVGLPAVPKQLTDCGRAIDWVNHSGGDNNPANNGGLKQSGILGVVGH